MRGLQDKGQKEIERLQSLLREKEKQPCTCQKNVQALKANIDRMGFYFKKFQDSDKDIYFYLGVVKGA